MANNEQYPIFTYGTLRNGLPNYHRLEGKTEREVSAKKFAGGTMYPVYSHGGFPCLVKDAADAPTAGVIVGELMYIKPDLYKQTLKSCDALEGYNERNPKVSMYIRELVNVVTDSGETVQAWVYFWNRPIPRTRPIESGDWVHFVNQLEQAAAEQAAAEHDEEVEFDSYVEDEEEEDEDTLWLEEDEESFTVIHDQIIND